MHRQSSSCFLPQRIKGGHRALLSPPAQLDGSRVIALDRAQSEPSGRTSGFMLWGGLDSANSGIVWVKGNAKGPIRFSSAARFRQFGSRKEPSAPTVAFGGGPCTVPTEPKEGLATHRPSFRISDVAIGNRFVDSVSKVRPSDVPHNLAVAPNGLQAKEGDFPATQRKLLPQERPSKGCTTTQSLQMQPPVSLGSQAEFSTDCLSRTGPSGQ